MKKITTIDLGSNSFRVLVFDCEKKEAIGEYHEVVTLADGLTQTKNISQEAQKRVIDAIKKSSKKLDYNPKDAICVTTAAMRMAKNSIEVLENFKKSCNVDFKIIDSQEEARLTLLAVKEALKREKKINKNFIVVDIGGGSTEIIINFGDEFVAKSFDFGIVTMSQKHKSDEEFYDYLKMRKDSIENFLNSLNIDLKSFTLIGTAGTPTTIASLKLGQNYLNYDKKSVNGTVVDLDDMNRYLNFFKTSSSEEIEKLIGGKRVEFVKVGIYIYKAIFEALKQNESVVFDDGLREGVAINSCLL